MDRKGIMASLAACVLALSAMVPQTAFADGAEPVVVRLESGADHSSEIVSSNDSITVDGKELKVIATGLKDENKAAFLKAVEDNFSLEDDKPVKIIDNAFVDAEKASVTNYFNDSALCWAASASNLLWLTEWAGRYKAPGTDLAFDSEDSVFDLYSENFVNKGSTYDYLIFDGEVPNGAIPQTVGTETAPVYTLLWDNWNSALPNDHQAPVYVALEFTNNAKDFWGHANKVRKGGTFYLTGKLDPTAMAFPSRTATNYNLPPYANADGSTIEASRVFIQDFMTTASFTIGETSLQHAYVTVPDLRSSEISLGLSVDIKWETGLTFPDVVLGE